MLSLTTELLTSIFFNVSLQSSNNLSFLSHYVLRQIFSEPWDILVVWTCTGLANQPRISRGTMNTQAVHSMQGKWWFPMALGLVTYTPCQYHAHQYQVQQLLEGIRLVYIFKQLNGVSGNVDFWMQPGATDRHCEAHGNRIFHRVFTPGKHLDPWKYILPL